MPTTYSGRNPGKLPGSRGASSTCMNSDRLRVRKPGADQRADRCYSHTLSRHSQIRSQLLNAACPAHRCHPGTPPGCPRRSPGTGAAARWSRPQRPRRRPCRCEGDGQPAVLPRTSPTPWLCVMAARALRFAPVRSPGSRMPCRERAVELAGGRGRAGEKELGNLCASRRAGVRARG